MITASNSAKIIYIVLDLNPIQMNSSQYVTPRLSYFTSHEKQQFFSHEGKSEIYKPSISVDALRFNESLILLGEPGFGKSRLLVNLFNIKSAEGFSCALIDLKRPEDSLAEYINLSSCRWEKTTTDVNHYPQFSNGFELSREGYKLLILDALDEVRSEYVNPLLVEIKSLSENYPDTIIILSCRTHHANRYKSLFRELNGFAVAELLPFSNWQIAEFIQKNDGQYSEVDVADLLLSLEGLIGSRFSVYNGPLATPRYLEYFLMMLKERELSSFRDVTRSEIFEFCLPMLLKKEAETSQDYSRKIPYLIQCFERLALFMEIQRTNVISKLDFASFEIDTNLSLSGQLFLETVYDRTLLKDNDDFLEFDNTEIQEYLAACALGRLGNFEQVIFEIAIEKRFLLIYPGWLSVLSYLVEQQQRIIVPLIEFGQRSDNPELFTFLRYISVVSFDDDQIDTMFQQIIQYSIQNKRWFWYDLDRYLAKVYRPDIHDVFLISKLDSEFSFKDYYTVTFISDILTEYCKLEDQLLTEAQKEKWKSILMPFLGKEHMYGTVMNYSLIQCLSNICTIEDFEPYREKFWNGHPDVFGALINFYEKIDPNHPMSIKLFLKAIIVDHTARTDTPLERVNTEEGFVYFMSELEEITQDQRGYDLWRQSKYIFTDKVITNLQSVFSAAVETKLIRILKIFLFETRPWEQEFISKIFDVAEACRPNFVVVFLKHILEENQSLTNVVASNIGDVLGQIISKDQYKQLEHRILSHKQSQQILFWLTSRHSNPEIRQKYDKHFPEDAEKMRQVRDNRELKIMLSDLKQQHRDQKEYEQIIELLNASNYQVFVAYAHASASAKSMMTTFQEQKIWRLVDKFLLQHSMFDLDIVEKEEKVTRYSGPINQFKSCMRLIVKGEYQIKKEQRQNILSLILLLWNPEDTRTLLKLLQPITSEEIRAVVDSFIQKSVDFQKTYLTNFLWLCRDTEYNLSSLIPFLKDFANDHSLRYHERQNVIDTIDDIIEDPDYLLEIFNTIEQEPEREYKHQTLQEINVRLLRHNNREAIEWRIQLILENKYVLCGNKGPRIQARAVGPEENLGIVLSQVTANKHFDLMLDALKSSFDIVFDDADYLNYAQNEFWRPITKYFLSLVLAPSEYQKIIEQLEQLIAEYQQVYPVHFYSWEINKIKRQYLELLSKPVSAGDATRLYLKIRHRQYLDLAYPVDVFNLVNTTIRQEFTDWVRQGYYQFVGTIQSYKGGKVRREELIQQTMVTQLEAFLLRRELRSVDIDNSPPIIYREVQLLDGKRADLIVSYGLLGSVMIEVKRMGNQDLYRYNQEKYRDKTFRPYMKQTNCSFGLFVIFLDDPRQRRNFSATLAQLDQVYSAYRNIEIIGVDCLPM